jgi:hypothetical protein
MAGIMRILLPSALLLAPALLCASALQEKHPTGYTDTRLLPGTKWHRSTSSAFHRPDDGRPSLANAGVPGGPARGLP